MQPRSTVVSPRLRAGWLTPPGCDRGDLTLSPEGRWITEYFHMLEVAEAENGTVTARLLVADPVWFRRLLLRLGAAVLGVDPPEAAESAAEAARRALELGRVG